MPDWKRLIRERLADARMTPAVEADVVEELAQHVEDRYRELCAQGASETDAIETALHEMDGHERLVAELAGAPRAAILDVPPVETPSSGGWPHAAWTDLRHAIRAIWLAPGFALTFLATMAITIGPTTAIVSVANWLLWKPPPGVSAPDRLAEVWFATWKGPTSASPSGVSYLNLADIKAGARTIWGLAGLMEGMPVSLAADGAAPQLVSSTAVTWDFFDVLGVPVQSGRPFTEGDDHQLAAGAGIAILAAGTARTLFGGPDAAVGKRVRVNGTPAFVVGVAADGFAGVSPFSQTAIWFPGATYAQIHRMKGLLQDRSDGLFYSFILRLSPDATFEQAQAELDVLAQALAARHPQQNEKFAVVRARVFPGLGASVLTRPGYQRLVNRLLGLGAILLLLGCANSANLLLFRGARQRHVLSIRQALGASRLRLIQFQLFQTLLLAIGGGLTGLLVASGLKELIQNLLLPQMAAVTEAISVPLDRGVLLVTLTLSLACAAAAGFLPAWLSVRRDLAGDPLRIGMRGSSRTVRVRTGLAAAQLALSLTMVIGALLLVSTVRNLRGVELGFDPEGVSTFVLELSAHGYTPARARAYADQLVSGLAAAPELAAVSIARRAWSGSSSFYLDRPGGEPLRVQMNSVGERYFDLLSIPVRSGRAFSGEDMQTFSAGQSAAIVSESLARLLFASTDVVGRTMRSAPGRDPAIELLIVGVVGDVRWRRMTGEVDPLLYLPVAADDRAVLYPTLIVKSRRPASRVSQIVEAHAARLDASIPVSPAVTLSSAIDRALAEERVLAWTCSMLGLLGFVLASLGLYGLIAQTVTERWREFGIRMALGASVRQVVGLVLRQAALVFAIGAAAGVVVAAVGSRYIESRLFGVNAIDPRLYALALVAMALIVLVASAWPARMAARVDPVSALRDH